VELIEVWSARLRHLRWIEDEYGWSSRTSAAIAYYEALLAGSKSKEDEMFDDCIRCNEAPAVDELGYCGHCHWAVRAETEEGFYQIREYLVKWARFEDWCREHAMA